MFRHFCLDGALLTADCLPTLQGGNGEDGLDGVVGEQVRLSASVSVQHIVRYMIKGHDVVFSFLMNPLFFFFKLFNSLKRAAT